MPSTAGTLNMPMAWTNTSTADARPAGSSNGRVMRRNTRRGIAPCTRAASNNEGSNPRSASESRRNGSGAAASAVTMIAPSRETTLMVTRAPNAACRSMFSMPLRGEPSQLQPIAVSSGVR